MAKPKKASKVHSHKYDENSIERHAGLNGVRKKPAMYVGPLDSNGLWTILREPCDNTIDRALAGDNDLCHIILGDDEFWVLDNGPGMPVGKKEFEDERGRKEKLSTLYVMTGLLHAGANFSGDTISRGTHGVGIKATNALSNAFKVSTFRDRQWWGIDYAKGELKKDVYKANAPKLPHEIKTKRGTVVYFKPDSSLFEKGAKIDPKEVAGWANITSYLCPGIEIKITDRKGKTKRYFSKEGPKQYLKEQMETAKCSALGKMFTFTSKEVDIAVNFSDAEGDSLVEGYTNGLRNTGGGVHLDAFYKALYDSLQAFKGKNEYTPSDLREGVIGVLNYKISAPKFSNQVKEKLIDDRVKEIALPQIKEAWDAFWKGNKSLAKQVVERAADLRKKTADFLKDKKLSRNVKNAQKKLPAKLNDIKGNAPIEKRELFLIEGDSAGGTAARARYKDFQATFALKGKPLNVMETTKDKVNNNEEIAGIFAALGLDPGAKNPMDKLRFGRVIFLADPDVDGCHINCLLLTLFWKYLPSLFTEGKVYLVESPLFKTSFKDKVYFGMTTQDVYTKCGTKKIDIGRLKGWGECSESDLRTIAMDPSTRTLYKVLPPDSKQGRKDFEAMMGKNSSYRKILMGIA